MNFVSRACSEGGSLAGPEAMVVWGELVTWLDLTQRPSPGLDLTPRGLGPTQPTSPGCSSERLLARVLVQPCARGVRSLEARIPIGENAPDIDVGAVARDRLAGVSAGSTVTPNAHLRQMSIHSFATAAGGVPCVQVVGSIVTPPPPRGVCPDRGELILEPSGGDVGCSRRVSESRSWLCCTRIEFGQLNWCPSIMRPNCWLN